MTLRELLGDGPDGVRVTGLAFDNRAVEPGDLFFCVPGFTRDGHDFAPDAVERGAVALVVTHPLGLGVPEVVVDDVRAAMAGAAALVVTHPLGLGVPELVVDDVRAAMAAAAARFFGDPTA